MLNESALKHGVRREACVIGVVAGDESGSVGNDAIARVWKPLPVMIGLLAVLGNREARQSHASRSKFGRPADHRNGQHSVSPATFALSHEIVRRSCRRGRPVVKALKIPIPGMIMRIE